MDVQPTDPEPPPVPICGTGSRACSRKRGSDCFGSGSDFKDRLILPIVVDGSMPAAESVDANLHYSIFRIGTIGISTRHVPALRLWQPVCSRARVQPPRTASISINWILRAI